MKKPFHNHRLISTLVIFFALVSCPCRGSISATIESEASQSINQLFSYLYTHTLDAETLVTSVEKLIIILSDIEADLKAGVPIGDLIDPDTFKTPFEMIASQGFVVEAHEISTEDNYTLTAWRLYLNSSEGKTPVILNHGFFDSSFTWILNDGNESLAYMLGYLGYDVWLTNNRGNRYSRVEANGSSYDQYWAFSWDEMAKYDLPANIQYVLNTTNSEKLHYIGHSQGTVQMFGAIALDPSIQNSLKTFTGLGPVAYVNHADDTLVRVLINTGTAAVLVEYLQAFNDLTLWVDTTQDSPALGILCDGDIAVLCNGLVESICGETKQVNVNETRMAVMASHEPGGSSLQNLIHWMQAVSNENFQMYDFGSATKNIAHYGTSTPPIYNVSNFGQFTVPGFMIQGSADALSVPEDLNLTLSYFPPGVMQQMTVADYGHLDYAWADTAFEDIYPQIVEFIAQNE